MINFSDITYIKNFSNVGLINQKSCQFLCYDRAKNVFKGNGVNPYLQNKEFEDTQNTSEFIMILSSNPNSQNVITYGSQICLMTKDFRFLTCLNNGEIKLENLKNDKNFIASNIPVNAKFALIDPNNQSNISRPLIFNDQIILRSNFGNFLMLGLENNVSSAGMIISEETTWKLTKTHVDQFPDWLRKRKYLNHNNVSYLYNLEKFLEQSSSGTNSANATFNNNSGVNLNNLNSNFVYATKKNLSSGGNSAGIGKGFGLGAGSGGVTSDKISLMTLSLELQEKCLIEDLLLVMLGKEGVFIKRTGKKEGIGADSGINKGIIGAGNNNINAGGEGIISIGGAGYVSSDFVTAVNSLNNSTVQNNIFKNFSLKFEIEPYLENPTCDSSLLYMVHKILPLSLYYDKIMNFINLSSNTETGIVSKSLIEAVNEIIREYIIFINQLEIEYFSDNLDIQKLWYLSQSSLKILENLHKLCFQSTLVKGGALLNIIYGFIQGNTDAELEKLYKFLLEKSLQKYLNIMKLWVCKGLLIDNFEEFMVVQSDGFTKENMGEYYYDLFWEKKFILSKTNTPIFLSDIQDKILFIGKCLNILRECKIEFICPYEEEFDKFLLEHKNKKSQMQNIMANQGQTNSNYSNNNLNNDNKGFNNLNPINNNDINNNLNLINDNNYNNFNNINSSSVNSSSNTNHKKSSIFEADIIIEFRNLIDKIYDWANSSLKSILYHEFNIISVLKSIKKFYFMECGDFYNHLIDTLDDLLLQEKNVADVKKIESIIDNALRSTSAYLDSNRDLFTFNLSNMIVRTEKIYLDKYNKILQISDIKTLMLKILELNEDQSFFEFKDSKVLESLVLDISVAWPLNLIFSRKALMKYKILFRQLLILKYEEKKLSEIWILQQNFKGIKLQNYLKSSYLLRDRMINFIKSIIYYFFNEVIEPNYLNFLDDLSHAKSIDDIIANHDKFLDNCLKECLLDDSDILVLLNDIITTCLVYSKVIIKYYNSFISDIKLDYDDIGYYAEKYKGSEYSKRRKAQIEKETKIFEAIFVGEKFFEAVDKFSTSFENRLESLMDRINRLNTKSNPHFISLLTKLDYNNYYIEKFSKNK